jgi:hypothetical protein
MTDEPTPQDIASELVYQTISGKAGFQEFAFEIDGKRAIVELKIFDEPVKFPERTYVALNPPGVKCECCKGTGKQKRPQASSGIMTG